MSDNFYVFLTSNVPENKGSQHRNKISDFITHLPEKIYLDDGYEVALSDIGYTKSWLNIDKPQKIELAVIDSKASQNISFNLPAGNYQTAEGILKSINKLIDGRGDITDTWIYNPPKIGFNNRTKKYQIGVGKTLKDKDGKEYDVFMFLTEKLCQILGFVTKNNQPLNKTNYVEFEKIYDSKKQLIGLEAEYKAIVEDIHSLYVYSDILSPRIVGNVYAPLFRQVEIPKECKFGEDVFIKYKKRYYHPLNHFEFDSIQIVIKDDTNIDIPFSFGRVTLALHFRKKSSHLIGKLMNQILK